MFIVFCCVVAIVATSFIARRLRRGCARRLQGRSLVWRVAVRDDGGLIARGWRLRLFGNALPDQDGAGAADVLRAAIAGRCVRLRVLAIDGDGTLAVMLRCDGRDQAIALLRAGLVKTRGSGARAHRQAQIVAQGESCGLWRLGDAVSTPWRATPIAGQATVPRWWQS